MAVLKCKMCGGNLNIVDNITVAECEYCGSKQTIPVLDDDFVLYERTENGMIKIDFTVHLTIDGLVNPRL